MISVCNSDQYRIAKGKVSEKNKRKIDQVQVLIKVEKRSTQMQDFDKVTGKYDWRSRVKTDN